MATCVFPEPVGATMMEFSPSMALLASSVWYGLQMHSIQINHVILIKNIKIRTLTIFMNVTYENLFGNN